jgi:hypothetical protein
MAAVFCTQLIILWSALVLALSAKLAYQDDIKPVLPPASLVDQSLAKPLFQSVYQVLRAKPDSILTVLRLFLQETHLSQDRELLEKLERLKALAEFEDDGRTAVCQLCKV